MQLTLQTDYALRVLIYLQVRDEAAVRVNEIATAFGISHHHLTKVVQRLAQLGYLQTTRGRGGGLRLIRSPDTIKLGDVVRQIEPNLDLAECFNHDRNTCPLAPACDLKRVLYEARHAFLTVLDGYCLSDITGRPALLRRLLQLPGDAPPPPAAPPAVADRD